MQEILKAIHEFLLEKLSEYNPINGSDYKDNSYIDFSRAIRIDTELRIIHIEVYATAPRHGAVVMKDRSVVDIYELKEHIPIVGIYLTDGNMSYKYRSIEVDPAAPGFNGLLDKCKEIIEYLQSMTNLT